MSLTAHAQEAQTKSAMQAVLNDQLTYKLAVGSLEDVTILLDRGASANAKNEQDIPALAIAIERNKKLAYPLVKLLIERGADVNSMLPDGSTALMLAIENEEEKTVWHLLKDGAEFKTPGAHGQTPLQLAQTSKNKTIISLMQKAHAIVSTRKGKARGTENRDHMLYRYAYYSCSLQYLRYLVASGMMDATSNPALSNDAINERVRQLDRYRLEMLRLFSIENDNLSLIRDRSMQTIAVQLDKLVSNRMRRMKKVGTQDDLKKRCGAIAARWKQNQTPQE